jgi:hypothetical protein
LENIKKLRKAGVKLKGENSGKSGEAGDLSINPCEKGIMLEEMEEEENGTCFQVFACSSFCY